MYLTEVLRDVEDVEEVKQVAQVKQVKQVQQVAQVKQVKQVQQIKQATQTAPPVSSTLTLRNADPQDQAFVDALTRSVMNDYVSETWFLPNEREAYFRKNAFDLQTTKIIHLEQKDIGRLSISETTDFTLIDNVQLLPEFQGLGIGHALINALIERSRDRKAYVKLQVLRVNPARLLFEQLGFYIYAQDAERFYMRTASEG